MICDWIDWRDASSEGAARSEEHTSELQSQSNLVCRLLLEKKKRQLAQVFLLTLPAGIYSRVNDRRVSVHSVTATCQCMCENTCFSSDESTITPYHSRAPHI